MISKTRNTYMRIVVLLVLSCALVAICLKIIRDNSIHFAPDPYPKLMLVSISIYEDSRHRKMISLDDLEERKPIIYTVEQELLDAFNTAKFDDSKPYITKSVQGITAIGKDIEGKRHKIYIDGAARYYKIGGREGRWWFGDSSIEQVYNLLVGTRIGGLPFQPASLTSNPPVDPNHTNHPLGDRP